MKKIIAISLVAILAVGSVFAAFTGSASTEFGYNIDTKDYGFIGQSNSVSFDIDVATASAEAIGEGDVYASIKASLTLSLFSGEKPADFKEAESKILVSSKDGKSHLGLAFSVDEAKVAGENWYVSILGMPSAPDFAKSAIDTYKVDKKKLGVVVKTNGTTKNASNATLFDAPKGVEVGYEGYVAGVGLVGDEKSVNAAGYIATPEYDFDGLKLQVAGTASKKAGDGKVGTGASAKVGYATDTLSATVASDVTLAIPTVENGKVEFNADVAANVVYDFVTVDAFYGTNPVTKADKTTTKNLLSAQVALDLNEYAPVTVKAGIKDAINVSKIFGEVKYLPIEALTVTVSGDYEIQGQKAWNVDGAVAYALDFATVTGKLGYGSDKLLSASLVASSDTLINGATVELGWKDAADLLNKANDKDNYGVIYTGLTIEF